MLVRKLPAVLCCALFVAALAAPLVDRRLRPERWTLVRTELRNPAPWPAFEGSEDWVRAPERLQRWFGDALGLREELVHGANWLSVCVFGRSPHPNLELGRNGFVFYAGDHSRETWRGQRPLSREAVVAWADAIRARREALAELGIEYAFCIAPNKEAIYPEFLHPGEEAHGPTPLEQLAALCEERHEPAWLDLRPALRAERAFDDPARDDWTYLRLGSHWSYRGGVAAAREVARQLAPRVRGLVPLPREAWNSVRLDEHNHDDSLVRSMHLEEEAHEPQIEWQRVGGEHARVLSQAFEERDPTHPSRSETQNDDPGLPGIYLLHDSFGQWIRGALAEHASRTWTRWVYLMPLNEISELHPDLVLQLVTERHLHEPPEPFELRAEELDARAFEALPLVRGREEMLAATRPHLSTIARRGGSALRAARRRRQAAAPGRSAARGARAVLAGRDLELAARGDLFLWYQTQADPAFRAHRRVALTLGPGRVQVRIVVPGVEPPGELLLEPTNAPGEVRVRALELRALGP